MLRHYTSIAETGISFKDRKSQRASLTVTDAEVKAALPPTRLGLRSTMSTAPATPVDLRSYSRKGVTTQVGSNLSGSNVERRSSTSISTGSGYCEIPSYMSDKQIQRIANDPIASLKAEFLKSTRFCLELNWPLQLILKSSAMPAHDINIITGGLNVKLVTSTDRRSKSLHHAK